MQALLKRLAFGAGPFSLMRWFSIVGAISIAIVSVALALVMSRFIAQSLIRNDSEVSRDFVQSIAEIQNVGGYFVDRPPGPAPAEFVEFFAHVAAMPDVLRANVWAPDGTALWSSTPDLIGQRFPDNDELEEAVEGRIVTAFDPESHSSSKPEHILLSADTSHFIEYYLPVRDPQTQRVIGVVELYKAPRSLWKSIAAGNQTVWGASIGAGLFLYLSLLWLVRRADRTMRRQQSMLVEAEGLAFVGELSAAVAHSIRNPLSSIRSTAELAIEVGDTTREPLDGIVRQVDRIESLLRTLLTYSRARPEETTATDIAEALRSATDRYGPEFRARGTRITLACEPDLPRVRGDGVLFTQALHSILANALEATGDGDRVMVVARRDARRHRVDVSVVDTGKGIPRAQASEVFKPFYTTKSRGLGLGLALVRRIVGRFGGEVQLLSAEGKGTCVRMYLPEAGAR